MGALILSALLAVGVAAQSTPAAEAGARKKAMLDTIAKFPKIGLEIMKDVRRVLLRRFPYKVIYRLVKEKIVVEAVMHTRREPEAWKSRLEEGG